MKQYISNGESLDLVTNESATHYICGNNIYSKSDITVLDHPLDVLPQGKYYLHVVPFYN